MTSQLPYIISVELIGVLQLLLIHLSANVKEVQLHCNN